MDERPGRYPCEAASGRIGIVFNSIGPTELIIVLVIVLLIFGPKRLPGLGRQLGSGMREFKESITGKDRDDETSEPDTATRQELDPAPASEPEVVTGQARAEDRAATRSDS